MLFYNKYAQFNYAIDKEFDAGMVLTGNQVKEIRVSKMNLRELSIKMQNGEVWMLHTGLTEDKIKLLLNRYEIKRLEHFLSEKKNHLFIIGVFEKGRILKAKIGAGVIKRKFQKTEQQKRKDDKIRIKQEFKAKNFDRM